MSDTSDHGRPARRGSHFAGGEGTRDFGQGAADAGGASADGAGQAPVTPPAVTHVPLQSAAQLPTMRQHQVSSRTAATTARTTGRQDRGRRRHEAGEGREGRGRNRTPLIVGAIAAVIAIVAVVALVVIPALSGDDSDDGQEVEYGTQVEVTIADGSGATQIAQALYDARVIESTSAFLTQVARSGAEASLKSGTYVLVAGADLADIVSQLTEGPNVAGQLTIPEGYTLSQVAATVESALGIPADEFVSQATVANYVSEYSFLEGATGTTLEGYLFPKTYSFTEESPSADTVIRAMLSQFQTEVVGLDLAASASTLSARYGITVTESDIVTMASIIEREALTDEQRGKIASVFWNRLASGMRLQSDATLYYSLGREVTSADLEVDDPYNTYTRDGLTPTPICNPGYASLSAACNPDDTDYLYFYITSDYEGFSTTYEEHLQVIANAG